VERIWMPGEQSHHRRIERESRGIPLAAPLAAGLDKLAEELGIAKL
jgi:LDH2 family malate/lactate/ureidoglycolate dehydrogenase